MHILSIDRNKSPLIWDTVSKFTLPSRGSPCDSTAFLFSKIFIIYRDIFKTISLAQTRWALAMFKENLFLLYGTEKLRSNFGQDRSASTSTTKGYRICHFFRKRFNQQWFQFLFEYSFTNWLAVSCFSFWKAFVKCPSLSVNGIHFWWRHIWRHLHVMMLQHWARFSNALVHWSIGMIRAKNYETVSQLFWSYAYRIQWLLFSGNGVYRACSVLNVNNFSSLIACYLDRLDEQFFSGAVEIFSSWYCSALYRKIGPCAYAHVSSNWHRLDLAVIHMHELVHQRSRIVMDDLHKLWQMLNCSVKRTKRQLSAP